MLLGVAVWQDFVFGDTEPTLAGLVTTGPVTGYDDEWQRMVERQIARHGGRSCTYIPRTPSSVLIAIEPATVVINLTSIKGEDAAGNVRVLGKQGLLAAREWYRRGFTSRPQRGDMIDTGAERFYVEEVDVVERAAPNGAVRDLKFRLGLTGASHRRS